MLLEIIPGTIRPRAWIGVKAEGSSVEKSSLRDAERPGLECDQLEQLRPQLRLTFEHSISLLSVTPTEISSASAVI